MTHREKGGAESENRLVTVTYFLDGPLEALLFRSVTPPPPLEKAGDGPVLY